MNCEKVRRSLSASIDGEALSLQAREHLEGCADCTEFARRLDQLNVMAARLATEPVSVPDVTARVLARLPQTGSKRFRVRQRWSIATGFAVGALIGAVVAGGVGGPRPSFARELPEAVVEAQTTVDRLTASFTITESITPDIRRSYQGSITYRSPEALELEVTQSEGPEGWSPNNWSLAVDGQTVVVETPFPCPVLGGCVEGRPRTRTTVGRDPFSEIVPAPLDAVMPVSILRNGTEPQRFEGGTLIGRSTAAFSVTAAQAGALLDAYFGTGNWREIHPTDLVDVWLDDKNFVPLRVTVSPAQSADRALWAARRGYVDDPASPYLVVEYLDVDLSAEVVVEPDAAVDSDLDVGFRTVTGLVAPAEPDMPLAVAGMVDGAIETSVWAWSDGRAWVRLELTTGWEGPGLFGNDGSGVRTLDAPDAPFFESGGGDRVFVHGEGFDAVITGSVASSVMENLADELPGAKLPIPADWPEAQAPADLAEQAWLPIRLNEYSEPIIRATGDAVLVDLFASGGRSVHIAIQPASRLTPPLDPDARAVVVRGVIGRYSPMLGLLEWTEGTSSVSIGSTLAGLDELVRIASSLATPEGGR